MGITTQFAARSLNWLLLYIRHDLTYM